MAKMRVRFCDRKSREMRDEVINLNTNKLALIGYHTIQSNDNYSSDSSQLLKILSPKNVTGELST